MVKGSVQENDTVANLERLFGAEKRAGIPVVISLHFYHPQDQRLHLGGPLEKLMHDIDMFKRQGPLSPQGFPGSGAEWLCKPRPGYVQEACRLQDRGLLGFYFEKQGRAFILRSEMPLSASGADGGARLRHRLKAGERRHLSAGHPMPIAPSLHPRMASEHRGPEPTRALEPPGFLAFNYGRRTPLVTIAAHLVYGALLGDLYRPLCA